MGELRNLVGPPPTIHHVEPIMLEGQRRQQDGWLQKADPKASFNQLPEVEASKISSEEQKETKTPI